MLGALLRAELRGFVAPLCREFVALLDAIAHRVHLRERERGACVAPARRLFVMVDRLLPILFDAAPRRIHRAEVVERAVVSELRSAREPFVCELLVFRNAFALRVQAIELEARIRMTALRRGLLMQRRGAVVLTDAVVDEPSFVRDVAL